MIRGTADFSLFVLKENKNNDSNVYFLSVSLTVVKSDPLSETRLTDQQYR